MEVAVWLTYDGQAVVDLAIRNSETRLKVRLIQVASIIRRADQSVRFQLKINQQIHQ